MTAVDQQGRTTTPRMDVLGRQVRPLVQETGHRPRDDVRRRRAHHDADGGPGRCGGGEHDPPHQLRRRQSPGLGAASYLDPDGDAAVLRPARVDRVRRPRARRRRRRTRTCGWTTPYAGSGGAIARRRPSPLRPRTTFPGERGRPVAHRHPRRVSRRAARAARTTGRPAQGADLTYDAVGRQRTSTDPLGRTTTWTYHDDGDVATRTSELGTVVTDTYDDTTGRLLSVDGRPGAGPDGDPDLHLRPRGTARRRPGADDQRRRDRRSPWPTTPTGTSCSGPTPTARRRRRRTATTGCSRPRPT